MEISKFCEECLKFATGECEGKELSRKVETFFGSLILSKQRLSGTNFCKRYTFDVQLYTFADGSGKVETVKEAVQRGNEKREVEDDQEAFDDFDLGASLSNKDFEGLI